MPTCLFKQVACANAPTYCFYETSNRLTIPDLSNNPKIAASLLSPIAPELVVGVSRRSPFLKVEFSELNTQLLPATVTIKQFSIVLPQPVD